ncbi:MAG: diguanylate cyclase domain-containing protein [Rhodoferax sp.]
MPMSPLSRHARRSRIEWLLLVLVLSSVGGYLAYALHESRDRLEARERERLSHQCVVVSMNLNRQFTTINTALTGILAEVPRWRKQTDGRALAEQHLRVLNNAMPGVLAFLVFDAKGIVQASDKPELVGKDFSQRDYFQTVLQHPNAATLYVRPPFVSSRGNLTMNLVRMIAGSQGEFDGLVVAGLDAEEFKVLLNSVIYRPGIRAALIHGDGVPFLMAPNSKDVEGVDLVRPGSFFSQHVGSGRQSNVFTGAFHFVGDERMVALQTIQNPALAMDKPMVIAVDRRLEAMYASWHRELLRYGLVFSVLTLLLVSGLLLHQRRRHFLLRVKADHEAERRAALEASRQSEERFRNLTRLSSDWYWEQDDQFRFVRLPGDLDQKTRSANDAHIGKTRWEMGALNLTEADWQAHRNALQSHREFHDFEMLRRSKDGKLQWTAVSGTPIFDALGNFSGYRGVARDITEHKLAEDQIKHIAFYDSLTQLPNRRFLRDGLALALAASKRSKRYGAVLFLDLDNFKPLNDKFGHEFGDLLLIEVADRLKTCVREIDTVARFGGDEFVVILGQLDPGRSESSSQAARVAEKIRASLAQPYLLSPPQEGGALATVEHHCTVCIGVCLFFNHEESQEEILKRADKAMYEAKQAGRNAVRFYEAKDPA